MRVIYADTLFMMNTVINYLLLLATAKICAVSASRLRMGAAAALGGVYAVFAAMPWAQFLAEPPVILGAGIVIILAAFGGEARIIRLALVFFAVSAAFAGMALAASLIGGEPGGMIVRMSFGALVLSFAVCYAVVTLVFRRAGGNRGGIVPLVVRQGKRELRLRALVDTGNSLIDPTTGMPVAVTGAPDAMRLFPGDVRAAVGDLHERGAVTVMETLGENSMRFRLIPYSAVGVPDGMLLAFKPDEITVNGRHKRGMLLAISPNSVSDNGTYSALV